MEYENSVMKRSSFDPGRRSHLAIAKLAQVGSNLFARFRDLCADVRPAACAGCPGPSAESSCVRDFCA